MSLFFDLPTDLHHHILQVWLSDQLNDRKLLRALSCLDIACCSHSLRSQLLHLYGLLTFACKKRHEDIDKKWNKWNSNDTASQLDWLSSRCVALKMLVLTDSNLAALTAERAQQVAINQHIVRLVWMAQITSAAFQAMLLLCPNVTDLASTSCLLGSGISHTIWAALTRSKVILTALRLEQYSCPDAATERELCDALRLSGVHLLDLRLEHVILTDGILTTLTEHCTHLRALHIKWDAGKDRTAKLLHLLTSCTHLQALSIHGTCERRPPDNTYSRDILAVLDAGRGRLTRFEAHARLGVPPYELGANALAHSSWLDYISIGSPLAVRYHRSAAELKVTLTERLTGERLEAILTACPAVTTLRLQMESLRTSTLSGLRCCLETWLASECCRNLTEVGVIGMIRGEDHSWLLQTLAKSIPRLVKLKTKGFLWSADDLRCLVRHCPLLQHLHMSTTGRGFLCPLTDEDMLGLLIGCKALRTLRVDDAPFITFHTLCAVLEHGVHLSKIFFAGVMGLDKGHVATFRQLAREKQLFFPVPVIVL